MAIHIVKETWSVEIVMVTPMQTNVANVIVMDQIIQAFVTVKMEHAIILTIMETQMVMQLLALLVLLPFSWFFVVVFHVLYIASAKMLDDNIKFLLVRINIIHIK